MRTLCPPLLVCIDFQREYAAQGRPLCIASLPQRLMRASRLLSVARAKNWIIAHALMHQDDLLFGARTEQAKTLEGFEPWGAEMVFCHKGFSAYENREFARLLQRNRNSITLMMGIGGPYSLLHTAMDAYARQDEIIVIEDVMGAPAIGPADADQIADATVAITGSMHRLAASDSFIPSTEYGDDRVHRSSPMLIGGDASRAF